MYFIMLEFLEVLRTRRSIRKYKSQAISKEQVLELLDLCRYAANAHNSQPYRFIILLNSSIKKSLIEAMAARYKSDLQGDGVTKSAIANIISTSSSRFLEAPILILACLTMEDMDEYSDSDRKNSEYIMGVQSVANALQNLLLIAHAKGLGACWYCAPLFCPDIVKSILNLPDNYIPQAFITIGIPDEVPHPIHRKTLDELVIIFE